MLLLAAALGLVYSTLVQNETLSRRTSICRMDGAILCCLGRVLVFVGIYWIGFGSGGLLGVLFGFVHADPC